MGITEPTLDAALARVAELEALCDAKLELHQGEATGLRRKLAELEAENARLREELERRPHMQLFPARKPFIPDEEPKP